ncbi:MAG: hypothetical protein ACRDSN_08225 [Pseudonocardiaceae bacterium]
MIETRDQLRARLAANYRAYGWPVTRRPDGTLRAVGPGGVHWHAAVIIGEDLAKPDLLDERLVALATKRMPEGGELCPLELIASSDSEEGLRTALDRTGLSARPHVSVYAFSAAAA